MLDSAPLSQNINVNIKLKLNTFFVKQQGEHYRAKFLRFNRSRRTDAPDFENHRRPRLGPGAASLETAASAGETLEEPDLTSAPHSGRAKGRAPAAREHQQQTRRSRTVIPGTRGTQTQ